MGVGTRVAGDMFPICHITSLTFSALVPIPALMGVKRYRSGNGKNMKIKNIFEQIQTEVQNFVDNDIEIVDGYVFNQYDTIKRCHLYYNSQFEDNSDYNGREKIFVNATKYRCMAATRLMDFDTKDIKLWPMNAKSILPTFILEKELKYWLKKNKMANILNQIAEELPVYGSAVLKKNKNTKYGVELVDLRRFFLDPTVDYVGDSRFIIQKHYLTASELRAMNGKWENVDQAITNFEDVVKESYEDDNFRNKEYSTPYYVIYERYGEVPESWVKENGDPDKMVRSLFITTDPENSSNVDGTAKEGVILFKGTWSGDYPFKDVHYAKTRGRWLGVGVIEDLFPVQERLNELANQKRIAMEISSMMLFQTSDQSILQNVLRDKESGDVVRKQPGSEGLQPINNTVKNFNEFQAEEQSYGILADRISFANDVVRGGEIAASTPATNALIQNNNSSSVFLYKRENFGNMITDFFNEFVIPQVVKDLSYEHVFRFTGTVEELDNLDEKFIDLVLRNELIERMLNGRLVTEEDKIKIREDVTRKVKGMGEQRFTKIKKDLYKNTDFEFDIITTNEQENVALLMQNTFQVMTALAQNPALLDDPRIKILFYEYMQRAGVPPAKIELAERQAATRQPQQTQEQQQGASGSLNQIAERIQQLGGQQPVTAQ